MFYNQPHDLFSQSASQPFPPNLLNILNHKTEELGSWNFERVFTLHNMSHVTCHFFLFFFGQSGEAYWWRVCYQRGLPRLVLVRQWLFCIAMPWFPCNFYNNQYIGKHSPRGQQKKTDIATHQLNRPMGRFGENSSVAHFVRGEGGYHKRLLLVYCSVCVVVIQSSTTCQQLFPCCTVCLVWLALGAREVPYGGYENAQRFNSFCFPLLTTMAEFNPAGSCCSTNTYCV